VNAHRIAGIILALALLSAVFGCSKSQKQSEAAGDRELNILCTVLPVYVLAQNVVEGASGVSLNLLLSPQIGCPHDYALTPTDAAMLEKADVVVMNGLGLETFLQGSPALYRPNLRIIQASQTVDSITAPHDHAMNSINPHAWVSPFEAAKMTLYLGLELGRIDTANALRYLSNAQKYAARLDSLGQILRQVVMQAPNRRIVTYHNAFDYFARDLGLEIIGVVESDPAEEPSARALSDLAHRIQEAKAIGIFSEPQYSDRLPRMLSSETGVPVYSLDPAASGDSDAESYLRIMRQNLLTLERALIIGH
jgi:zinc transport system substrate-binding protein